VPARDGRARNDFVVRQWRTAGSGRTRTGDDHRGDPMELFEALYTTRAMRRMQLRDVPTT
jgi:hypothetical protein